MITAQQRKEPQPLTADEQEDLAYMQRTGQGLIVDCPEDQARAMYPGLFASGLVQYWCAGFSSPAAIRLKAN